MLGDVVAIKSGVVRGADEFQAFVELDGERAVVAVDVVEKSNLHLSLPVLMRHFDRNRRTGALT
jgi:hypothetical protein